MPPFKDLAIIAGTGQPASELLKHANGHEISQSGAVTAGDDELKTSAWLVYEYMLSGARNQGSQVVSGAEDNVIWYRWSGSMTRAITDLDLVRGGTSDERAAYRREINRWLNRYGNAVCVRNTRNSKGDTPDWAVRAEFREVPAPLNLPAYTLRSAVAAGSQPKQPSTAPAPQVPAAVPEVHSRTGVAAAGQSEGEITCPGCQDIRAASHIARHYFTTHLDPLPFLTGAIQHLGTVHDIELARLMSQVCGGGVVTINFVQSALSDAVAAGIVTVRRGKWRSKWYDWAETGGQPATPSGQGTSQLSPRPPDSGENAALTPRGSREVHTPPRLSPFRADLIPGASAPPPAISPVVSTPATSPAFPSVPTRARSARSAGERSGNHSTDSDQRGPDSQDTAGGDLAAALGDLVAAADRVRRAAALAAERESAQLVEIAKLRDQNGKLTQYRESVKKLLSGAAE